MMMDESDLELGSRWIAKRNPYPLKGFPNHHCPWDLDAEYEIVSVVPLKSKATCLVAFKSPDDPNPMSGWEIGEDSFRLGFERFHGALAVLGGAVSKESYPEIREIIRAPKGE